MPERYRVLVLTAAYTGARASELYALRRKDIDVLHGRIYIRDAIKGWENGAPIFGVPKNSKPRPVSLPQFLRDALVDHLSGPIPSGSGPEAFVFTNGEGRPIYHVPFMRNHWRPAVKRALSAELHGLRFHDLRHTAASLLIAQGANPKQIQERLGHASITLTLGTYGHLLDGHDDALLAGMDAAWDAKPPANVTPLKR
jgi:integrase